MVHKILLIEDDATLLDMYRLRFEKEGFDFFTANRGKIGIELAAKERPDLILLDIVMPEMDGYQVLEQLKKTAATKEIPVVMLSNLGQHEEIDHGMKLGAADYFIKASLTPSDLVARVAKRLGTELAPPAVVGNRTLPRPVSGDVGVPVLSGVKVLLIEDNSVIVDMYTMRLQKEGATVTAANNGAWGMKLAAEQSFDIVLLDMVMPALHGVEVIQSLKSNPKTASVPVLVFSNSAQDEDREAAVVAGAVDYLIKSNTTPAALIQRIKLCLQPKE